MTPVASRRLTAAAIGTGTPVGDNCVGQGQGRSGWRRQRCHLCCGVSNWQDGHYHRDRRGGDRECGDHEADVSPGQSDLQPYICDLDIADANGSNLRTITPLHGAAQVIGWY